MGIFGIIIIVIIIITVFGAIIFAPFYLIYTHYRDKSIISDVAQSMNEIKAVLDSVDIDGEYTRDSDEIFDCFDRYIKNIETGYTKLRKAYSTKGFEQQLRMYEKDYKNVIQNLSDYAKDKTKKYFAEFDNTGHDFKLRLASKIYFRLINKSISYSGLKINDMFFPNINEMNNYISSKIMLNIKSDVSKITETLKMELDKKCDSMRYINSFDVFFSEFNIIIAEQIDPITRIIIDKGQSLCDNLLLNFALRYAKFFNERLEYFYYKIHLENLTDSNTYNKYKNLVENYFSLFYSQPLIIDSSKMGNYEEFISFFDENENNFIELTKIIKSDNNSLIDNFIQKYSNTEIRDPRFIKLSELFYSKGYTLSNSVLYRYINYISNLNEIQNIISSFKQNCREEIIDCIEFYLSIDFEENNRKVKSALIEYVNITFGNRFTIDKLDEMISDSKKSLILRNFEQNLKNDGYDKIDIDLLTGYEFENYLSKLFTGMGYIVEETKLAGDQGADLVIEKMGVKTVVQAKRYNSNVGNSAIQEIVASKNLYNADEAMVVTNSFFTQSAIQLAKSNNVKLIDRDSLNKMIENSIY